MNALEYFKARAEATISPMGVLGMRERDPEALVLVDVRIGPVPSLIPGAIRLPENEVAARMHELPKDRLLVLYCWDTSCSLAMKAAIPLLEAGFQVKELFGGVAAWTGLKLPLDATAETSPASCAC